MSVDERYPGDEEFEKARREEFNLDPSKLDELMSLSELHPDLVKERQIREQELEEVRDFAKGIAAYWTELSKGEVPPAIAAALVREFQQGEIQIRLNLAVYRERMNNE